MRTIAESHHVSIARIALAWLLHQPQVTSVIIGAKRPDQLADNIGSTEVRLTAEELEQIGKVSQLPPEYPGWMFDMQGKFRRSQIDESLNGVAAK
jgi:aryl-alcohol dehydrogenase-like predicted oxidoreductase